MPPTTVANINSQDSKGPQISTHLVVGTLHYRHVHVVSGGTDIFILLTTEQVNTNQVNFGMTVFASLGCGHLHNFAGTALQRRIKYDRTSLPKMSSL